MRIFKQLSIAAFTVALFALNAQSQEQKISHTTAKIELICLMGLPSKELIQRNMFEVVYECSQCIGVWKWEEKSTVTPYQITCLLPQHSKLTETAISTSIYPQIQPAR